METLLCGFCADDFSVKQKSLQVMERYGNYYVECGIRYARTTGDTHGFALQSDLLRFKPSFHHADADIMSGIDRFLNMDTDEPQLLYIWGHSYEFDVDDNWEYMESILKKLAFHDDIFYGTNSQVLL